MFARFGTMPQEWTLTSTSLGPGSGMSICSICIGSPTLCIRAALIFAMIRLLASCVQPAGRLAR
jgi:hypothetical protein